MADKQTDEAYVARLRGTLKSIIEIMDDAYANGIILGFVSIDRQPDGKHKMPAIVLTREYKP